MNQHRKQSQLFGEYRRNNTVKSNAKTEPKQGENICTVHRSCGGCQTWNLTYGEELSMKMSRLIGTLGKFGHVEEILAMEDPYHYRNKLQALFQYNGKNQFRCGIYQSSSRRIVRCDNCLIENREATRIVRTVAQLVTKMQVPAWDPAHRKGVFRHVMVRHAAAEDAYMVVLVTSVMPFAAGRDMAEEIVKKHPKVKSVVNCKNSTDTPLWMEDSGEVLWGSATVTDRLVGCLFRISARSFYQVNTKQTEKLYETALRFAELKPSDRVVDAYCGIGTIGIAAAKNFGCASVIGFDNNGNAVRDAEVNARINGLENITFHCADAGEVTARLAAEGESVQVLFADPPRAGLSREMLEAIGTMAPERMVYVSCNPDTLAKDLEYLRKKAGYRVLQIQPVDMFPRTTHCEVVVSLRRKDSSV